MHIRAVFYKERLQQFSAKATQLKSRLNLLSVLRLLVFIVFVYLLYKCTQTGSVLTIIAALVFLIVFFILVKRSGLLRQQVNYFAALAQWNEREAQFLESNLSVYDNGKIYEDPQHPYSYDLDVFGDRGLFAYLNRCSTAFGKKALAHDLLQPDTGQIRERQQAIAELADKVDFRQQLYAHGSLHQSKKADLQKLLHWIDADTKFVNKTTYYLLMVFPLATLLSLALFIITENDNALNWFYKLFVLNLIITFSFVKKITSQLSVSTSVTKILENYSNQLRLIENERFQSSLLQQYQQLLKRTGVTASQLIKQLATRFNYLETIVNLVVSLVLNGLLLFHIHILYRLGNWKKQHAHEIKDWLQLIGKVEASGSFGNLLYNNPNFCFPEISPVPDLEASDLGHILVKPEKRVCNDVSFHAQKFIILTGSNMSGKSTFLRTLGSNLILAKSGSPVCASSFRFFPFEVYVSMRITDSLQDSESFFYAELKRLQSIIRVLQEKHTAFVILDEILRGTNSNDKRNGTIGLVRKMVALDTFGIIATHDVVVADLKKEYPAVIANMAFESAIVNDELLFDYKLKDGICTTLSASYLMKKMDII